VWPWVLSQHQKIKDKKKKKPLLKVKSGSKQIPYFKKSDRTWKITWHVTNLTNFSSVLHWSLHLHPTGSSLIYFKITSMRKEA
jgi:hypothetical protein